MPTYGRYGDGQTVVLPARQDVIAAALDRIIGSGFQLADTMQQREIQQQQWTQEQGLRERQVAVAEQQAADQATSRQARDKGAALQGVTEGKMTPEQAAGIWGESRLGPLAQPRSLTTEEQSALTAPIPRFGEGGGSLTEGAPQTSALGPREPALLRPVPSVPPPRRAGEAPAAVPPPVASMTPLAEAWQQGQLARERAVQQGAFAGMTEFGQKSGADLPKTGLDVGINSVHQEANKYRVGASDAFKPQIDKWEQDQIDALKKHQAFLEQAAKDKAKQEADKARAGRAIPAYHPPSANPEAINQNLAAAIIRDKDGNAIGFDVKQYAASVRGLLGAPQIATPEQGLSAYRYVQTVKENPAAANTGRINAQVEVMLSDTEKKDPRKTQELAQKRWEAAQGFLLRAQSAFPPNPELVRRYQAESDAAAAKMAQAQSLLDRAGGPSYSPTPAPAPMPANPVSSRPPQGDAPQEPQASQYPEGSAKSKADLDASAWKQSNKDPARAAEILEPYRQIVATPKGKAQVAEQIKSGALSRDVKEMFRFVLRYPVGGVTTKKKRYATQPLGITGFEPQVRAE